MEEKKKHGISKDKENCIHPHCSGNKKLSGNEKETNREEYVCLPTVDKQGIPIPIMSL